MIEMENRSKTSLNNAQTIDSKYIQQHLANERTFLAWIRTAIAIIGVGFLITNLHFTMKSSLSPIGDFLANIIGLSSVGIGILTIIMATFSCLKKINAINNQVFHISKMTVIALGIFVIMIALTFGIYFIML